MAIVTAKVGTNADLFPDILAIYGKTQDRILDMTYNKGVFWQKIDRSIYDVVTNDLYEPADFNYDLRSTEFESGSFDIVVLDPPYMHMSGTIKQSIAGCYNNNTSTQFKNQAEVRELYRLGAVEGRRLLKQRGILIVKCKDTVESGKQRWNHNLFMEMDGFYCEDLFILIQQSTPAMDPKWGAQKHARKNHSYFLILRKVGN